MDQGELNERLSRISTVWTLLRQAHAGPGQNAASAQQQLIQRYGKAIRSYLLAAVRDPHVADDLVQEFALCLLRGEFRQADPGRGKFRSYVKTVLFHLVSKHYQREKKSPRPLDNVAELSAFAAPAESLHLDREFDQNWRDVLLNRVWEGLARAHPDFHGVLLLRAQNPKMPSGEMAKQLSSRLGKTFSAASVRQSLHRARALFVDMLLDEIVHSLEAPTPEQVHDELRDLNLLEYCQPGLDQRFGAAGA